MTVEHTITCLSILLLATAICLLVLTIDVNRERRRTDDILFQIEIINDTHALMWKHILKEEKHDAKEGKE